MLQQYTADLTTDGSGDGTAYLGSCIRGQILAIKYLPGTIATGATLTITGETTGQPVLTKANAGTSNVWFYPMAPANKVADGAASTLSEVPLWLHKERLKVVVASGGASRAGSLLLLVDEEV
jgi:hypothetical protein